MIFRVFSTICLLMLTTALPVVVSAQGAEKTDTRVLIDISGSMKQNDPENLRGSALRLLVGLMPNGNRAGVWTFAQYTNMLIPLGEVNPSWKKRARLFSEKISSPGQFTNIEDVLKQASSDWKEPDAKYSRNIILLTDGMVDISKKNAVNSASRDRILETLAPAIKAGGGAVHTIALSDRADHELMKDISGITGGWNEQVNSAEELQRVFLRIFEKVGKPDSVPLQGNSFTLDQSISEATLLVFTKPDGTPASLKSPSGKVYTPDNLPSNITWHRDQGYDLVTVSAPESGKWTIEAEMDPDNRVMVVTDLKMRTSEIPNRIALGESVPVNVSFTENDKTITKASFIEVVNVSSSESFGGQVTEPRPLSDDGVSPDDKAGDGVFSIMLGDKAQPGSLELILHADGKTFERERRQTTEVVVPAKMQVVDSDSATSVQVKVALDGEVVAADTVTVAAWLEGMGSERTEVSFSKSGDNSLEAVIDKNTLVGRQFAMVNVAGKTLSDNEFIFEPEQFSINGLKQPEPQPQVTAEPVAEPAEPQLKEEAEKPAPAATEAVTPEAEPVSEPEEETDWAVIGLAIGGGNLLLALIGGGIWWFVKKRNEDDDLMLLDENQSDETSVPVKQEEPEEEQGTGESLPPLEESQVSDAGDEQPTAADDTSAPEKADDAENSETVADDQSDDVVITQDETETPDVQQAPQDEKEAGK